MSKKLQCLAVEPYYGGSHKYFLDNIITHSHHNWDKITLPSSHWKWRMSLGALDLSEQVDYTKKYDILFVSDYLDLARFIAHSKTHFTYSKKIIYFHENQLTYPHKYCNLYDFNYVISHISSIALADHIWFNSEWHYNDFSQNLLSLQKKNPDKKKIHINTKKLSNSKIIPIGLDFIPYKRIKNSNIKTILWNHRWESDKNPELFYKTLVYLKKKNTNFNLILLGKRGNKPSSILEKIKEEFSKKILIDMEINKRKDYLSLLKKSDIVISTSNHEFFGISILEAIASGCVPILPNRLSYRELIPVNLHKKFLYNTEGDLFEKTYSNILQLNRQPTKDLEVLHNSLFKFQWENLIKIYDCELNRAINNES